MDIVDQPSPEERLMDDVALNLKIKYGLERDPTDAEVAEWLRVTRNLLAEGEPLEKAGALAAQYVLPGYQTHVYKSQAQNLEALLRAAAKK
jgi:hypothetical protein